VVLGASVVLLACLGGIYAWSIFVPPLHEAYGVSITQAQTIYGVFSVLTAAVMLLAGGVQERRGPRPVAVAGGVLYGAGYWLASYSHGSYPLLLLGLGVLAGMGNGAGYITPVATCVKWFPARRGMVTGLAVAGYGGGALVLIAFAQTLFARGVDVLVVFRWIGAVYGPLIVLSACVLSVPPGSGGPGARAPSHLRQALRELRLWPLALGMFTGVFAGAVVISNLKLLGLAAGAGAVAATLAVSAFAVGNTGGRLGWGWLADRLGPRAIPLALWWEAGAIAALLLAGGRGWAFAGAAVLLGLGYGANMVLYVARVATLWGEEQVGHIYPAIFACNGLAALMGPVLAGLIFDRTGAPGAVLALGSLMATTGALGTWLLMRLAARRPGEADR